MASLDTLTANNGVLELDDNGTHNGIINVPASLSINIDSDIRCYYRKFYNIKR